MSGYCEPTRSIFYSNCSTFNIGCYLYYLSASQYIPVDPGTYSDGTKCASVQSNGYINTWEDCGYFYEITKFRNCNSGQVDTGTPLAYGYFPDSPTTLPNSNWWYRDSDFYCGGSSGNTCYANYITSNTPLTGALNPTLQLIPLSSTLYDQGSNGANVCNQVLVTPTPTPTNTVTISLTPTNTPTNTLTPTSTPTSPYTISYSFTATSTNAYFEIVKNGSIVVSTTTTDSNSITAFGTDTISVYTSATSDGINTAYNSLTVVDNGTTLFTNTASDPNTAYNSYGTYSPTGNGSITANSYEF